MKKKLTGFLLLFLFVIFTTSCSSRSGKKKQKEANSADSTSLQILFPKGGEKLVKGKTYRFRWRGGDSTLALFLIDSSLESQGASVSIADRKYHIRNTGSYEYTVPRRLKKGKYRLTIGKESSGYFEVVPK